jgi:hypothetical protein
MKTKHHYRRIVTGTDLGFTLLLSLQKLSSDDISGKTKNLLTGFSCIPHKTLKASLWKKADKKIKFTQLQISQFRRMLPDGLQQDLPALSG